MVCLFIKRRHRRVSKWLIVALLLVVSGVIWRRQVAYWESKSSFVANLKNNSYRLYSKAEHAEKIATGYENQTCRLPRLDLWNRDIESYIEPVETIICDREKDWVYTHKGKFYISAEAQNIHGNITCKYTPFVNRLDSHLEMLSIERFPNESTLLSDAFDVSCVAADGKTYERSHPGIAKHQNIASDKHPEMFNVFMLGLDSLSRLMFIRLMPRTYEYFTEKLGGAVLEGYNILGDGTPAALMPMLTGEQESEIVEVRRGHTGAVHVDEAMTFIWNRFKQRGYVTQWAEDQPDIATFNLRMLGFKTQPVHHYMRTFYTLAYPAFKRHRKYCYGSKARHGVFLDWLKEGLLTNKGRRFFTLGFFCELSHDDNSPVHLLDNDFAEFMTFMKNEGFLDRTVFLLFSDHGARHGSLRATEQGRLEERMPFVGIYIPNSFKSRFPKKAKALNINTKRLTSPFDIHETLIDILNDNTENVVSHTKNRGLSLFKDIPVNRTCSDVGIAAHWCTCMRWKPVSVVGDDVSAVVEKVVTTMNDLLREQMDLCHSLSVHSIQKAETWQSNEEVLKFKGTSDVDGRVADFSDDLGASILLYHVQFTTSPGMGLFEATVKSDAQTGLLHMIEKDVSRLNWYGEASHCVSHTYPKLRPYCVCRKI